MKQALIMGMPVNVTIVDPQAKEEDIDHVFDYFRDIDRRFSTYKKDSEIERINRGEVKEKDFSPEMKKILALCEQTRRETNGYFDIHLHGKIDPSGIVKGYAIHEAIKQLAEKRYRNFFVEIAGDIETSGNNEKGEKWRVGIRNPFMENEIVKIVSLSDEGIATSGTYRRGNHIHNPISGSPANDIASMTVIASDAYNADRFATAAFAMGEKGIGFIESLKGYEGYMITKNKRAYYTSGFEKYMRN